MKVVRFWVLVGAAVLSALGGLSEFVSAVGLWTTSPVCGGTPGTHDYFCVRTGPFATGTSPWVFLAIGLGLIALAGCFVRLANRVDRGRVATR